jgi:hypothetical protein
MEEIYGWGRRLTSTPTTSVHSFPDTSVHKSLLDIRLSVLTPAFFPVNHLEQD